MDLSNIKLPNQVKEEVVYPDPVQGRVAQIDADFMSYQVSAETRDELDGIKPRRTLDEMKRNAQSGLEHLMQHAAATSYVAHLTPSGSDKGGRAEQVTNKEYQGNRKDKAKPEHLETIRTYIAEHLNGMVHLHQEADDGMATANYRAVDPNLSVIVSKDKDLRMVSGLHYDFDTGTVVDVDDPFGLIWVDRSKKTAKVLGWGTAFFWAQMLMGDTADNIQGLPCGPDGKKVGPIKAYEYLKDCTSDWQCFQVVKYLWAESTHEYTHWKTGEPVTWKQALLGDAQALWMRSTLDKNDVIKWMMGI